MIQANIDLHYIWRLQISKYKMTPYVCFRDLDIKMVKRPER